MEIINYKSSKDDSASDYKNNLSKVTLEGRAQPIKTIDGILQL